jgi:hypothetical protein
MFVSRDTRAGTDCTPLVPSFVGFLAITGDETAGFHITPEPEVMQVCNSTLSRHNQTDAYHLLRFQFDDPNRYVVLPGVPHGFTSVNGFSATGVYPYICEVHPEQIQGTIVVVDKEAWLPPVRR